MIYVRPPTDEEHRELKRMARQEIGRVSQRAQTILLSAQRRSVPEIAALFEWHAGTVRYWIRQFDALGPAGLYDQPRSGRPRKVTPQVEDTVLKYLPEDPHASGYLATFWTVAMLVLVLAQKLQVTLSPSTVRSALQRLGLRWGRPRLAMPDKVDPEKASKQWAIAQAVVAAGPEATVLYEDESRVQTLPLLRAMWHWVGQQLRIPTPGTNTWRALFGALDIRSGRWTYTVREHMRTGDFIAFLEHLLTVYPVGPLLLIVDNYGPHTAKLAKAWLNEHPRLQLFYLPKYCSHLNPVEPIWLRLKNALAANRLYGSITVLLEAVDAFFAAMTPEQALVWAAV